MNVFISWSGDRSREVAKFLSDWIKCVLQATRPWISTRDIDRGALWFNEIGDQLKDTTVGIICLTQENKTRPWILFEAGALAKGLSSSRVITFLVDLSSSDIRDPLAQFNHTTPDKDGLWELVQTLNRSLGSNGLEERILNQIFETYWPQFQGGFDKILKDFPASEDVEKRGEDDILAEILENTRSLSNRVRSLESNVSRPGYSWPRKLKPNTPRGYSYKAETIIDGLVAKKQEDGTTLIIIDSRFDISDEVYEEVVDYLGKSYGNFIINRDIL